MTNPPSVESCTGIRVWAVTGPNRPINQALGRGVQQGAIPPLGREVWQQVEALLRLQWSPEQIVGRLEMEQDVRISHEWINQYMHADKRSGADLYCYLRCRKKRPKRYGSYDRRGIIPKQVSIDERPAVVDTRQRYGDWERRHRDRQATPGRLGDTG